MDFGCLGFGYVDGSIAGSLAFICFVYFCISVVLQSFGLLGCGSRIVDFLMDCGSWFFRRADFVELCSNQCSL